MCYGDYLQHELPFTSVFYKVGFQAGGEANDKGTTFRFFGMRAQKV